MSTKGHESEAIRVEGVQHSFQKFKDDLIGIPNITEAVYYTQSEANAYNALLTGALDSTTPLTAEQAAAYNAAVTGATKEAGDTLSAEEAAAYNATLDGAVTTEDVKTPAVPKKVKDYVDDGLSGKQAIINDNAIIGNGYAVCSTAAGTAQKEVTISNFLLIKNGVVSVKFANTITVASPTLKINDIAAKAIYLNGEAVQPRRILAGATVNMRYNGAQFDIISITEPEKIDDELLVDLGLPSGLLWATQNIDVTQANGFAASPYQYECSFFSWGNTDGHNPSSESSFAPYSWGSSNNTEPYASSPGAALTGNIGLSFDAASVNLGNQWRMPTSDEFAELFNNIDYINPDGTAIETTQANKLVTVNGVVGILLKSKNNSRTLFFPCSGFGNSTTLSGHGGSGNYWSSSHSSATGAYHLNFSASGVIPQYANARFLGFSVRAVQNNPRPTYTQVTGKSYYSMTI